MAVDCSDTTTSTTITWFVNVCVSRGSSCVELGVFQWFLPGFGYAEEVYVIVGYEFAEYCAFFVE